MSVEKSLELNEVLEQVKKYCAFSLGLEAIENTEPSFDKLIIKRDHERMSEALNCVVRFGTMPFAGISDIRLMLANAAKGRTLTPQDFSRELSLIRGIRGILAYEKTLHEVKHDALNDLIGTLVVHQKVERKLASCFNEYGEVMDNATPELRSIRSSLRHADSDIAAAAARFVASHADSVVDSIVTYRNGRAVVLVRASEKNTFGGMVYGDSSSGAASYIEPKALVGPNNRKQELLEKEAEEINRILQDCSREVQAVANEEIANIETCGILDCIFAKAQWGKEHDAVAAVLSEEKAVTLKKARHPLIDPQKVISNNYNLRDPHKVLLITGPNTGGKTVSMKVIGLFVLMTYCGMPVTAEEAVLPFFDRVFADIGDDQSVVSSLSSFSAHVTKQAEVCRSATANSLVLLDEAGSGTDPREGESLAIAILNTLREIGCMTVATTHYSRLKAYGKRHDDILVASVQFDMEKLAPTYKYLEGITGQSNAFEVAERCGLPKSIIKYARFLKNQAKTQEDILIERLEKQLNETELRNEALLKQVEENRKLAEELKKEKAKLEKEKDEWSAKAEREAAGYIEEARKEADEILKEMRQKMETAKYHEVLTTRNRLKQMDEEAAEELSAPVDENEEFEVGDAVELRSSSQVCEVISINRRDITILLNGREVRVKKNQIRHSARIIPKQKPQISVNVRNANIFATMSTECNLIGLRVEEGIEKMDDYMDEAMLHGLKHFRIIHGDGTGRLRKAVHQRLQKNPGVKEFRVGMPNEGGTGATIVTMK